MTAGLRNPVVLSPPPGRRDLRSDPAGVASVRREVQHEPEKAGRLLEIDDRRGAKHSSLDRGLEFARLAERDRVRPDFRVYTGNDLAIGMIAYGSEALIPE